MFGGLGFMLSGHMCVGIVGKDLMVRVGKEAFDKAVSAPHARPMDFTGTPSTGMVYVAPVGEPFDPGRRRLMKEWLTVVSPSASWIELVREAHAFVEKGQT
jgi:TfoX N-terminal domain